MEPEQQDANTEIIERLERIERGVQSMDGRVTAVEKTVTELTDWQLHHQPWSEQGRDIIEEQSRKIEEMSDRVTEVLLACQVSPANLERAVGTVLDNRQLTQDAASYRALIRRFGNNPEEPLNRWAGVKAGARAIGWKIAMVVITLLVTGMMAWVAAVWAVSSQGGAP